MSNQKIQNENNDDFNSIARDEIVAPGGIAQKNKKEIEEMTDVKDLVALYVDGLNNQAYE